MKGNATLGPVSRKPRKLFGPVKSVLFYLHLKTEKCVRLKLLVWMEPLFVLRICEWDSSVIVRFEFLLWFYMPEKFPGISRNRPLERDCRLARIPDRPYSYSRYWTGTSFQLRLMYTLNAESFRMQDTYVFWLISPCMSLDSKLVPVQHQEYENSLLPNFDDSLFLEINCHTEKSWIKIDKPK